ncbi:MAG TPA: CDF family Co(II)/Ni(II) efflux transporter DmeF, partial [Roseiarcus sp.]|nr:CDF family Co(II)/Ni(II) efflux transporter DmeF [Roseiarcus sp.]
MDDSEPRTPAGGHSHDFLGADHARSERNVWAVIALTSVMMVAEIGGGAMFGSIALVADGFHMSTHAGALLLAALAYTYARRRADDPRFTFGTGKFGDLAGFASAIILATIAALIAYESIARLFAPMPIAFAQAIPIAALGLAVNAASAWLLSRGGHEHGHGHGHPHAHEHSHEESRRV